MALPRFSVALPRFSVAECIESQNEVCKYTYINGDHYTVSEAINRL